MTTREEINSIIDRLESGSTVTLTINVTEQHILDAFTDKKGIAHYNLHLQNPISYAMYEATGFCWEWQNYMATTGWFSGADMSQHTPCVARDEQSAQIIQGFLDEWNMQARKFGKSHYDPSSNPAPFSFEVTLQ